ncbi:NifB/NifX family molybdenum-iron cluster-binding protein [bacterium]|nr:NifB/NifX family molybdenum-iron cluster-binding protein [candidate division CSSED10-310 bacterium]
MKVLVTSEDKHLDSPVDVRFARARYFIVVETETGEYQAIENSQNLNATQGAGVQAGQAALDLGVEAVITGHVGPKAFATLLAADIDVYVEATGSVRDAVQAFKAGSLSRAVRPDVESHW